MSSNFDFFGNTIIYPKLNLLILTRTGNRILFNANFLKWYFFTSLMYGAYYGYKFLKRLPFLIRKIYLRFKPLQLKNKNLAIIFGFGDSYASIKVTKALITLGFDLILINKKETFEHRKKYSLNKNEQIEELDKNDFYVSYEDIIQDPEILKRKIGNEKIDFLFDFTCFRINFDSEKINKENEELARNSTDIFSKSLNENKFRNKKLSFDENESKFKKQYRLEKEKEKLEKLEKIEDILTDKKSLTAKDSFGNTNLIRKLNQNVLQYYNSNIFYSEELCKHINEIILITESLIPFMQETKIMIFNYKEKNNDINHKLMVDFKNIFFNNLKNLADKNKNFIFCAKVITGLINYKAKQFTEQDAINIIRFSDMEDYEYYFI